MRVKRVRASRSVNDVRRAVLHVDELKQRIAQQLEKIRDLKQRGLPTTQDEAALASLKRSLLEMQNHKALLGNLLNLDRFVER